MPKLNEQEVKQVLRVENRKQELTEVIDNAINELTYVRVEERLWWRGIVDKYHLNKKKFHRIWLDGEILEERRMSRGRRKIF